MMRKTRRMLGWKLRFGRLSLPVWVLTVLALTGAGAGQAVGPVLSGDVTGTGQATIEQTVVLHAEDPDVINVVDADDWVATVNDEGTNFTLALETQVGQFQTVYLDLINRSAIKANAVLELNVPAGIDVEPDDNGNSGRAVDMAQMSASTWLFTLDPTDDTSDQGTVLDQDIVIVVEPKDDLKPGFYTISGRIVQIGG